MGFIKTGDDLPVVTYYNEDLEAIICEKCEKPIITAALDDKESKLICECEMKEDDE